MPETRLGRALLSAIVIAVMFVVAFVALRILLWLFDGDARWVVVLALVGVAGFSLQWWTDRRTE